MKALLKKLGIMVVGWLIDQSDNDDIRGAGETCGKWITDNAREQLGDGWENIEDRIQIKSAVFMGGVAAGLDYDDKE